MHHYYNKLLLFIAIMFALFVASPAHASGSGGDRITLDSISAGGGHIYLWSSRYSNPDSCASSAVMVIPSNTPGLELQMSIAMTAIASGKPVSIWVDGCVGAPWFANIPKVVDLWLHAN